MQIDFTALLSQLGVGALFAFGLAAVSLRYWAHYEDEIRYLRGKVDTLESELIKVKQSLLEAHLTNDKLASGGGR